MKLPKFDVGLIWAKFVNIWGQVATVAGVINFVMMLGVFYTTTVLPNIKMPLWAYLLVVVIGMLLAIGFVLKWGISGYYRFFSNQSELSEVNRKVSLIMKYLNIQDDKKK